MGLPGISVLVCARYAFQRLQIPDSRRFTSKFLLTKGLAKLPSRNP
jgi:hypothetical protein